MNLPSEKPGGEAAGGDVLAGFPIHLSRSETRKKDVSRLEFHAIGRQGRAAAEMEIKPAQVDAETQLEKELATLTARIQSQAEEFDARIKESQKEAKLRAREEWEKELEEQITEVRQRILCACEEFDGERARYFAGIETEVVKLALAIAARVLHREVQLDPLLLTAVVRVALEKVAEDSELAIRVPPEDASMWRKVLEGTPERTVRLVEDEGLNAGECVLDTNVGKVELGIGAQLVEIEKGFFDLLQRRPA